MRLKASIIVLLIVTVGIIAFVISDPKRSTNPIATAEPTASDSATLLVEPIIPEESYTVEQVALHNLPDDCWTIIDSIVYDITPYVPRHPGGSEILRACGADGTTLFTQRKTVDDEEVGSGTPHSPSAANQLANYAVGTLVN